MAALAAGEEMAVAHEDDRSILALDRAAIEWGEPGERGVGWAVGQVWNDDATVVSWRAAARAGLAGLVIDGQRRYLHASVDGTASVYWLEERGATYFCSHLEPLARTCAGHLSLDWEAWASIIAFRYPVGERTPFAEVRRLPRFSTLRRRRFGGARISREAWPWKEVEISLGVEEAGERIVESLRASMASLPEGTPCPLSGGRDSRILFLSLCAEGRAGTALTVSDDEGDTYEEDLAEAVASASGAAHERLPGSEAGYPEEWAERARRVEFQFADHAWLMPLARRIAGSAAPVPDGFGIDVLFTAGRHFYNDETLDASDGRRAGLALFKTLRRYGRGERALIAPFADSIEASAREQFREATREFEGHLSQPILSLYATRSERGVSHCPTGLLGASAPMLTPGTADAAACAALAVAPQAKLGGALYEDVLRRLSPAGALPSTANTPRRPAHLPRRWCSATAVAAHRRRLEDGPLAPYLEPSLKGWLENPAAVELSPDLRLGIESIGLLHEFCRHFADVLAEPEPQALAS
jgi:hypothetical protein